MSNLSKQLQTSHRDEQGASAHRGQKPARHLLVAAGVIGGAGIVLGAPAATLFVGSGVAQAAPLVSAPTDVCASGLVGCADPSASGSASTGSSLFGGSAALTASPAGAGLT